MRYRASESQATVYAVAGTHVVSIAVDMPSARASATDGPQLFGFGIARRPLPEDADPGPWQQLRGYKFFPSLIRDPKPGTTYDTFEHHWQNFIYSDFLAEPASRYEYAFHPFAGDTFETRAAQDPLTIVVTTEPLKSEPPAIHEVYFNRGVASSQAYVQQFGRTPINKLEPDVRTAALTWLSRGLDIAMLSYIHETKPGERLLCCLYEFTLDEAIEALVHAIRRGVDVRLILDYKGKETSVSTPRSVERHHVPEERIVKRLARSSHIAHNKFMVRVDAAGAPTAVWTGSTNFTQGAITAQTNVAHVVHDPKVTRAYAGYWDLLSHDPGGKRGDDKKITTRLNSEFIAAVERLSPAPKDLSSIPDGTSVAFSPRSDASLLNSYASLLDTANINGCITLPFNEDDAFRVAFGDNTYDGPFIMVLLNKEPKVDRENDEAPLPTWRNNVYSAFGAGFRDPVSEWLREAYPGKNGLGLTGNVDYIHSKFILVDPLSADPTVITGSANFSVASLKGNDENSLIIRGDTRVGDIYFTEFVRLFEHYLFRSVVKSITNAPADPPEAKGRVEASTPPEPARDPEPDHEPDARLTESQAWTAGFHHWRRGGKRLAVYRMMADPLDVSASRDH